MRASTLLTSTGPRPAWTSAAGGAGALALAAAVHVVRPSSHGAVAVVLAYGGAVLLLALTARRSDGDTSGAAAIPAVAARGSRARLLGCGLALGIGLAANVAAVIRVHETLVERRGDPLVGFALWLASLAALLAAAVGAGELVSGRPTRFPARTGWRPGRGLPIVLAGVLVVAAAVRLAGLGSVPRGINADEGNRAAAAISILSGVSTWNPFESGWYYISNFYFCSLAVVLKVLGTGYAEARALGAVSSLLTVCVITWIGFRHFGPRMGVLTAILAATLGLSLQFARETTEATPTALLWAVSIALLLEGASRGRLWAWTAAGMTGALSVYFYPTGRLWFLVGGAFCIYVVLRAGVGRRWPAVAGTVAVALGALAIVGPFLANAAAHPGQLTLRARQTSVFSMHNVERLAYYDPDWNVLELLWAQLGHAFSVFADAPDDSDFWPSGMPVLGAALTVLTMLGVGWFTLSWRDLRRITLALWFWIGFVGVVVTVETPNVQRLATAVPVIPLLAAGVLDELADRVAVLGRSLHVRFDAAAAATVAVIAVALTLAASQAYTYFGRYGDVDAWSRPTLQGRAAAAQGDALVLSLARNFHEVNAGWVRLLAHEVSRAGVPSPGSTLPLPAPPRRDLTFMLYPDQAAYVPYLRDVYPGGSLRRWSSPAEGLIVQLYRVPRARVAELGGSIATWPGGVARVPALGAPPANAPSRAALSWSGAVWAPSYWNYRISVSPGPVRLRVDGVQVLTGPDVPDEAAATVALARGRHLVTLEASAGTPRGGFRVGWSAVQLATASPRAAPPRWSLARRSARGLFGHVRRDAGPELERLDETVATCCLQDDVDVSRRYVVTWTGTLAAPRAGSYGMALFTQGAARLSIDGKPVIRSAFTAETVTRARVSLTAGRHDVRLVYRVDGTRGGIEWTWTPPGRTESIVPPTALSPPPGAGVGPPLPASTLRALASERTLPMLVTERHLR